MLQSLQVRTILHSYRRLFWDTLYLKTSLILLSKSFIILSARTISTVQEKSDSEFDDNENIYDNKLSRTEEVVREDIKDFQVNTK